MSQRSHEHQAPSMSVVGHRGLPEYFPENSLIGLVSAAKAGAHAIELDVQMSADGIPVVLHDATLDRVSDSRGNVWDFSWEALASISVHEPTRFEQAFFPEYLCSLETACRHLAEFHVPVFIELKKESLDHFGREKMVAAALASAQSLGKNAMWISFDVPALNIVRALLPEATIGWVLPAITGENKRIAESLRPNILISNYRHLRPQEEYLFDLHPDIWSGPWEWFLYDIVDLRQAEYWVKQGVRYIETWNCKVLLL